MRDKVLAAIKKHRLLRHGQKVLVAFSGGADSLSLLHVLHKLSPVLGISLHAAHIHHGLRPAADKEAAAVKKIALQLGLPVTVRRVRVKALQKGSGRSVQDVARRARYAALARLARQLGADCLVTAHHRDDRIETFLMRLLSGSGLDGLSAIPISRKINPHLTVVRPLWEISRMEIEAYCETHHLRPLQDESNFHPAYLRNRVRLRLLPFLEEQFGAHIRNTLARSAGLLQQDAKILRELAEKAFQTARLPGREMTLAVKPLQEYPPQMQLRILRRAMWEAGVERPGLVHAEALLNLARSADPSAMISLPGEFMARRRYEILEIAPKQPASQDGEHSPVRLEIPGTTALPWCRQYLTAELQPVSAVILPPSGKNEAFLDADCLSLPLYARPRKPGDRLRPLGAPGSRKIKKILIDKKVPRDQRENIPLIISGEDAVWLCGVEIAAPCAVTSNTKNVLHLILSANPPKVGDNNEPQVY